MMDVELNHGMTTKRKDFEDVNDDFTLSSPATKIRRLDADLPPIVEEYEKKLPIATLDRDSVPEEHVFASSNASSTGGLKIGELPDVLENNERSIVLFNPLSANSSNFSISIDPYFISGLKNQVFHSSKSDSWILAEACSRGETEDENDSNLVNNRCLAVVPWVPSHNLPEVLSPEIENLEMMDADENEGTTMEVEDDAGVQQKSNVNEATVLNLSEGLQQWQQHCMVPQPPNNGMTPIFWYR